MRVLITGAKGHSGCWLIERMQREKFDGELVCIVRSLENTEHLDKSGLKVTKIVGDLNDLEKLNDAMNGVDAIIHIAGIGLSPQIINCAIENHVNWAILVHTTGRYSKYKSASAGYIQIEENILKLREKINITIVRPTMIYGSQRDVNMHKLIAYLDKIKFFPMFGEGKNLMQPVHARDLGNAYYDILIRPDVTMNREYNLSGRFPITYMDIVRTTSKELGRKNVIIKFPLGFSVFTAKVYNFLFGKHAIITVEQVLRMQEDKDFSYDEARKDFGYDPISFEDGIHEEVKEYKKLK